MQVRLLRLLPVLVLLHWIGFAKALPFGLQLRSLFGRPTRRATVCNGRAELCNRSYSNITYIGSHNSYGFSVDPLSLARNQEVNLTTQLNLGVRLLQAQSHMNDGVLHFCHTSCLLFDGGPVIDYLNTVKTWLDQNPNEVLTLLFTNPEGIPVDTGWEPLFDQAGISPMTYVPPNLPQAYGDWPTLGEMIQSGKRVVVFMDAGASQYLVPFIMPEFQMIWENPFTVTDPTFPCSINRISGPLQTDDHMYMINHSLDKNVLASGEGDVTIPDYDTAPTINSVASILADAYQCAPLGAGRNPAFVLLDFVDVGQAFQARDILNGLPPLPNATTTTTTATPSSTHKSDAMHSVDVHFWSLQVYTTILAWTLFSYVL